MLVDARDLEIADLAVRRFDVCICGAGVAGITLALSLRKKGLSVALLEGGGLEKSEESQELYTGKNIGLDYYDLDTARLRFFGGSSQHWGGMCRPLDDHDFLPKPHHELSGWPIAKSDLDPYLERTRDILDISLKYTENKKLDLNNENFKEIVFWQSGGGVPFALEGKVTRFKRKYKEQIESDDKLFSVLNANVNDIILNEQLGAVQRITFISNDKYYRINAQYYILCFGAIENARFLLNCNRQIKPGVGNEADLVGRFFCEHPHFTVGYGIVNEERMRIKEIRYVAPTLDLIRRDEINNFSIRLIRSGGHKDSDSLKRYLQRQICILPFAARLAKAYYEFSPWWCDFRLDIASEQTLNQDSRVRLSDERDQFGLRKVALDWRLNDLDQRTMRQAVVRLGEFFALEDFGRIRVADWLLADEATYPTTDEDEVGGFHHMCTTRMSDGPQTGVVDRDCKVFGLHNLFIAGSSVFATTGHANPTFTIVQLSLRLADTVAAKFGR